MRWPSLLSTTALILACCFASASAFTCFSKNLYHSKIREVRNLARKTDMGSQSVWCLYKKGMAFKPEMIEIRPGEKQECYKDTSAIVYMVRAMADCIDDMERVSRTGRELIERETVVRRKITPDNPIRSVAHWLGLEENVRTMTNCHCWSGCHYCCIQTGIGGHDYCFDLYCRGSGSC